MTPAPPPGPRQTGQSSRTLRDSEPSQDNEEGRKPEHDDPQDSERNRTLWEAQRAALAEAFPAWKIVCVSHLTVPLWFALYREPLTPQQEQAGFRPTMLRDSAEALQAELALRCRTTRLPLPAP